MSDKLGHLAAYALLMFQFFRLYKKPQAMRFAWGFVLMGIGLECLQYFTATRSFELADMAANSLGVAAGWLFGRKFT